MQTNHASTLRGLSIAVVIISGLAILGCLIGFVFLGMGGSYLSSISPDMWEYYMYDGDYYGYEYYGVDGSEMSALMGMMVALGGVMLLVAILFTAVALVAGILGLRNYQNPAKLSLVFGWSVAGAITSLLTGNIVTMTLLIIMCVFAYKDKQMAMGQPMVVAAPVQVQTAAPVVPVQPVQPVAAQPAQPVATQPATVAQPAAPEAATSAQTPAAAQPVALEVAQPAASETVAVEETVTPTAIAEEVIATEEKKAE